MKPNIFQIILILISLTVPFALSGQKLTAPSVFFIQPEFLIGKNISNYEEFPESTFRSSVMMSLGNIHTDSDKHWVRYYNYPSTGVSVSFSHLGNPEILSNEVSITPFVILKTSRNLKRSWNFKMGIGASYFDKPYNEIENPYNYVIGSKYNWGFQLFCYKNLVVNESFIVKLGLGYTHNSNAHTQLPNYGLNSAMMSLALQFPARNYNPYFAKDQPKKPINRDKHYFLYIRSGIGWHELGGTVDPIGGPDWAIYSQSISGGIIFKQQLKLSMGFTYRFYESFYDYVRNNPHRKYVQHPRKESSNVNFFLGFELLMGHVGIDIEGAINLHKPFYEEYNERWEFKKGFEYWRSRYITTRLGLKYYMVNNEKMPRHNVSFGAHINANFGEADFMDLSIGYTYLIK